MVGLGLDWGAGVLAGLGNNEEAAAVKDVGASVFLASTGAKSLTMSSSLGVSRFSLNFDNFLLMLLNKS